MPRLSRPGLRRSAPLVAIALLVMTSGCGGASPTSTDSPGDGIITQIASPDRKSLPTVAGRLLDDRRFDSRVLRGHVVVYNLWGSWCAPCHKEAPALRRVAKETRRLGVRFVGLDVRDNDQAARAFERRYRITYPSVTSEDSARALLIFGSILPTNAVPSTVVVDSRGRAAARVIGPTTYSTLSGLVHDVLVGTA